MSQAPTALGRKLLTAKLVAERYGVNLKTIDRWTEADILPQPLRVNHRRYWNEFEIEQRERERMAKQERDRIASQSKEATA